MALAEGRLDMYSGEDGLIVPLMSIGAKGVISVLSNVAPKQTHDICATFAAGMGYGTTQKPIMRDGRG